MRVCNENLFIYAYGYCVYPGCKHTCVCAPCRTRQSLRLLHRCYAHYTPPTIVVLFVHHDTYAFVLCTYHRFASSLFFLLRSFFERSPGILCFDSVFFTIPCIFWHYPRHRKLCCILYNNSLILSSLTANLMCYLLQHHLRPLSSPITQQKHRVSASSRSKLAKNRCYSTLFLSHL